MDLLQRLVPASDRYATLPIADAFNWQAATTELGDGEWYLVAFRSIRRPGADEARLTRFDDLAHEEAASSPGCQGGAVSRRRPSRERATPGASRSSRSQSWQVTCLCTWSSPSQ